MHRQCSTQLSQAHILTIIALEMRRYFCTMFYLSTDMLFTYIIVSLSKLSTNCAGDITFTCIWF